MVEPTIKTTQIRINRRKMTQTLFVVFLHYRFCQFSFGLDLGEFWWIKLLFEFLIFLFCYLFFLNRKLSMFCILKEKMSRIYGVIIIVGCFSRFVWIVKHNLIIDIKE